MAQGPDGHAPGAYGIAAEAYRAGRYADSAAMLEPLAAAPPPNADAFRLLGLPLT
jgi:predicted Zn-dependent protease